MQFYSLVSVVQRSCACIVLSLFVRMPISESKKRRRWVLQLNWTAISVAESSAPQHFYQSIAVCYAGERCAGSGWSTWDSQNGSARFPCSSVSHPTRDLKKMPDWLGCGIQLAFHLHQFAKTARTKSQPGIRFRMVKRTSPVSRR